MPDSPSPEKSRSLMDRIKNFKPPSKKNMFLAWIAYQTVKGTITTTFIWVPAILYWLHH